MMCLGPVRHRSRDQLQEVVVFYLKCQKADLFSSMKGPLRIVSSTVGTEKLHHLKVKFNFTNVGTLLL